MRWEVHWGFPQILEHEAKDKMATEVYMRVHHREAFCEATLLYKKMGEFR
jgi:hypothetical protein